MRVIVCHFPPISGKYPTGIKVSDEELAAVNIKRASFHGDWKLHALTSTQE